MTKRVKTHAQTLHFLAKCDNQTRKAIINSAKPELINCFSDICHNILKDKVALSSKEKLKLSKYKKQIRSIAGKKATLKTKKTLIQRGGFLASLLAPLVTGILGPLAKGIFGGGK